MSEGGIAQADLAPPARRVAEERTPGERHAAESEVRAALELMPQLVWTTTPDGYHDYYNERWYEYTGMPRPGDPNADAEGWKWSTYLHPEDYARTVAVWQDCLATGVPYEIEYRFREGRTGVHRWFLGRALPQRDASGAITRWFGTCTDIHDHVLTTERLVAARAEAEEARREAESAARVKSEFMAVMSHELRTPLNAIAGYAQLMELGIRGPVTDEQRLDLSRIQKAQRYLMGLIADVLNLAHLDSGRVGYALQAVPVNESLDAVELLVGPQFHGKGVAYDAPRVDSAVVVRADREKLQQILVNVLTNALKFTPAGGRVAVSVAGDANTVTIRVRDTGIGIPPDKLTAIFEPFVQVGRALDQPRDGIGLGLSISRELARGMGGELTAESSAGAGSTFALTLPRWA